MHFFKFLKKEFKQMLRFDLVCFFVGMGWSSKNKYPRFMKYIYWSMIASIPTPHNASVIPMLLLIGMDKMVLDNINKQLQKKPILFFLIRPMKDKSAKRIFNIYKKTNPDKDEYSSLLEFSREFDINPDKLVNIE